MLMALALFAAILGLGGCTTLAVTTPVPTVDNITTWEVLAPGLEKRTYLPEDNLLAQLHVLRIDPAYYVFRAQYRPGAPLGIASWRDELPGVAAFINANFFDPDGRVLGLVIADGMPYGQSYQDRGGTFIVQNGDPRLRSNILEPYAGEPLEQAVQAFPMLVLGGEAAYADSRPDRATRRTVVGEDINGRILFIVTSLLGITLADLSAYLVTTDMSIINAINLDGGGSSMLYYHAPGSSPYMLPSVDPVPIILAAYAR